ncbi:MAG: hypothetical protein F6K42_22545 [Leptolyngbya sp. SIO1D8]|nr:hypothetical protein [Leptolyngbya sp. SIO1D8]
MESLEKEFYRLITSDKSLVECDSYWLAKVYWRRIGVVFMGPKKSRNLRASLNASAEECRKALAEYSKLARLPELSEEGFLRMQAILEMAESNDVMSLLINEIDEMTFQELGLYDKSQRSHFEDEVSRTQEFVLDETERKVLTPSIIARQTEFVNNYTASFHHPRVEMVFDASRTSRIQLERGYSLDDYFIYYRCRNPFGQGIYGENCQGLSGRMKSFLYKLFVEESISLLTVVALIGIIFCLA